MIALYLASFFGFLCYVAVFAWNRFESLGGEFDVLTLYIRKLGVIATYGAMFGFFGLLINFDAIPGGADRIALQSIVGMPGILAILRSFAVGLGGPMAASRLVIFNREPSHIDDITHIDREGQSWIRQYSRALFS
jgi:hypothetical protein